MGQLSPQLEECVSAQKISALGTSPRELSEGVLFGIGTLLVVELSSLETSPRGCDIHGRIRQATIYR